MSKQVDYTPEEWKTISTAPVMAGLLVSVSDLSGPIGIAKEALAVVKAVGESTVNKSNELIKAVAEGFSASVSASGDKPSLPSLPGDRAGIRNNLIETCKQAAAVIAQKSPAEVEEYKRWLVSLAQRTAQASKEGGFLGIGGILVSDAESAAVNELAAALHVGA